MSQISQKFIAIVDDDQAMRESISDYLTRANYHVKTYSSAEEFLTKSFDLNIAVVVSDLRMPGKNGMDLLKELRSKNETLPVILITAHGDIPTAVEAIQNGAFDFIEKPFEPQNLRLMIDQAITSYQIKSDKLLLKNQSDKKLKLEQILVGQSNTMSNFRNQLIDCANHLKNLVLVGDKGTEKTIIAKIIHQQSPLSHLPYVHVNCKIVSELLFDKMFLGQEGAFSRAGEGVVFLEDIDSLPVECRKRLLNELERRVFQYEYKPIIKVKAPQIICSMVEIPQYAKENSLIGVILSRFGKVQLNVPSLKERPDDIVELFNMYLTQTANQHQVPIPSLLPEDVLTLSSYEWPKNQRQLKQIAEQYVRLNRTKRVSISLLLDVTPNKTIDLSTESSKNLRTLMQNFERQLITQAMIECSGNINQVCSLLKIPRRTLNEKLLKHDLTRTKFL
ncbi:MAG: sigma-54 dependent transcriptional regulator [Candidatus Thioglobus sp.]|nr:sigma-54 dependent transcriptional regulator [Candidatus Pseudothioglobus singularis]MDG1167135.1 sigma-54 dependent transcriptional regulator [Candidatus Thioglobus sp.]MDG1345225.1 sigma-54 dependent transcriptional regulator [Candidatus Thioglobus sp.]MDG1956795.1 sigma-54 dependent transcriptional regulator [Candidatus Thioglobus sp.]